MNAEGWRKIDVLMEVAELVDTPSQIENTTSFVRLALDVDAKKCFCAIRGNGDKLPVDEARISKPSAHVERLGVSVVQDSSFRTRKFPDDYSQDNAKSFEDALLRTGTPSLETIGVWSFDFRQGPSARGFNEQLWTQAMLSASQNGAMTISNLKTNLTVRSPINKSPENNVVFRYEFSNETLMPTMRSVVFETKRNGQSVVVPHEIDRVEWKQKSNVFVPKTLEVTKIAKRKVSSGEVQEYEHLTMVRFYWLRVNEEIDPKYFNFDRLTAELIHKMTDLSTVDMKK